MAWAFAQAVFAGAPSGLGPYRLQDLTYDAFVRRTQSDSLASASSAQTRGDHPAAAWRAIHDRSVRVQALTYPSDGMTITGVIVRPMARAGRRPVLIWARGGVGPATLGDASVVQMAEWARRGYVVVASNYRGEASGQGRDEFAGDDVNDLHNLMPVVRSLPDADPDRTYAIGFSRGALMLYRAVAEGLPVRAIVTVGGLTDLADLDRTNQRLTGIFRQTMPDYQAEQAKGFCRRSPVCWPERLKTPILLIHGGNDRSVDKSQAIRLADRLEVARLPYRLIIVGGADHGLTGHRAELLETADRFFRANPGPGKN